MARWVGRNLARLSYAFLVEPTWLELNQREVRIGGVPAGIPRLRVVHLTDFHMRRRMPLAYIDYSIRLANAQQPDLIALTGDFVHRGFQHIHTIAERLGQLKAPLGVYGVLGNHDVSVRTALGLRRYRRLHRAVARALSEQGIRVLRNESVSLDSSGQPWAVVGVDDLWSRSCDLERAQAGIEPDQPRIILAHNPRTIEHLGGRRCDLMLSGHTHGGQVYLQGLGTPTLGRRMRRYCAGLYQVHSAQLYVNKGIGYSFRFRYNRRPEVAVLDLVGAGSLPTVADLDDDPV